jgi:hypothetical protein
LACRSAGDCRIRFAFIVLAIVGVAENNVAVTGNRALFNACLSIRQRFVAVHAMAIEWTHQQARD